MTLHSTAQETVGIQKLEQQNCLLCIQLDLPNIYSHLIKVRSLTHWGIVLGVGTNAVKAVMDRCRHPTCTPAEGPLPPCGLVPKGQRFRWDKDIAAIVVQWFYWLVCHWDAWWSLPPCPEQPLSRFHFTNTRIINICALCWQHMSLENDSSSILRLGRCTRYLERYGLQGCDSV